MSAVGVLLSLTFFAVASSSAQQAQKEAGSNRDGIQPNGAPDSVWSYLESADYCPETGNVSSPGKGSQEAQDIWVGSRWLRGGERGLTTETAYTQVCDGKDFPKLKAIPFCSGNKSEIVKTCDASAKIFGVSSAALMCTYGASTLGLKDPTPDDSSGKKKKIDDAMTDTQKKQDEEHYRKAQAKFEKLAGPAKDKNGKEIVRNTNCYYQAEQSRKFLNMVWPAVKGTNFMMGDQCDYNRTLVLMAIYDQWGLNAVNKVIQMDNNGVKLKDALGGDTKKLADAVLGCMSHLETSVGAPGDINKGSCQSDVWN